MQENCCGGLLFMGAKIQGCAIPGLQGTRIEVGVDIADGCAALTVVGLSFAASCALKERVCSAITSSGYSFPHRHSMVNLTPVDLRKGGPAYDLPMVIGILLASGQINAAVQSASQLYLGTLSPDGSVRHIPGILPMVAWAQEKQIKTVFVPVADAREAALMQGVAIYLSCRDAWSTHCASQ